jgi:UDP-N-acetylglucosamine--N-acetylmuramyl-(pentapeptide) pyrophosphoryl-undecaprenol N-acetylglucosamine transferase
VGAAYVIYESVVLENGRTVGTVDSQRLVQRIYDILDNPDQQAIMEERGRETFDQHGLKRIIDLLNDLMNPVSGSIQSDYGTAREEKISDYHEADTSLSPFGLVKRFRPGRDETFIRSVGEDYLKYRVDGFLKSPRWPIRNEGVKLVGLLNYQDRVSFILSLLQDKTPVSWIQRLLGGDYKQVGFIRRNAVTTIQQLGLYNKEIRKTLLDLLDDPYYEVRTVAARAFAVLIPQDADTDTEIVTRILDLIQDRSFEVKAEAVLTLGKIGTASVTDYFRPLYLFPNWKVRTAVISALTDLVRRHLISDLEALQQDLDNILVTCVHFEPTFPIKQTLNNLTEVIRQHQSA